MEYKGYHAVTEFDADLRVFHGEVININDVITFEATTADDLIKEFHTSVDVYLQICKKKGKTPDKSYSGKFNVRLTPSLHKQIHVQARKQNKSINDFMIEALEKAVS